jgi:NAD(P)-dependent dehydrogenase (short-subunit alcohol dehydrogenase family)
MTEGRLQGKRAIVTGAGSGIGAAIALRFAAEGAWVAIAEIDVEKGRGTVDRIQENGGEGMLLVSDVADRESVFGAAAAAEGGGGIDILVNNAGVSHIGNIEKTAPEDFEQLFRVNVAGVFHWMQAVMPGMARRGSGVVLNMASIAGELGIPDRFAYSMTKGAVISMTLSAACDYVRRGVRCNAVCPARVHTPFVDDYLRRHYPGEEEAMFQRLSATQPVGRMAEPEEIAALAAYLCSDEAAFVTGSVYDIDGGFVRLKP